jgi:hypothetical protein
LIYGYAKFVIADKAILIINYALDKKNERLAVEISNSLSQDGLCVWENALFERLVRLAEELGKTV